MKNKQVCKDFVRGEISKTKHLFTENKEGVLILYSYGYHFPLSIKLLDNTILINGRGYSQTTSQHKGDLCRCLGFENFKGLEENKTNDILIFNTEQLKEILDKGFKTKPEIIEDKI